MVAAFLGCSWCCCLLEASQGLAADEDFLIF